MILPKYFTKIRYVFGFPFNGDSMMMPDVQKWQDDEIELSRRMIQARDLPTTSSELSESEDRVVWKFLF